MTAARHPDNSPSLPTVGPMVSAVASQVLNHLLSRDDDARGRLAVHAGKRVHLTLERQTLRWKIGADGLTQARSAESSVGAEGNHDAPDLHLTIDTEQLRQAIATHAPLTRSGARISGDAELAQTVSWLMEHLRWDAEDDLARWLGDIPARRIARIGRDAAGQLRAQWDHMQTDARDWFAQKPRDLVGRPEMAALTRDVADLRDAAARLDKQLALLRRRLNGEG